MKLIFVVCLIGMSLFTSCEKKELEGIDNPDEPDTHVELDLKNQEKIRLWCSAAFSFNALENGEYTIEVQNPLIAKARVDGKTFTIKTLSPGETDITIRNNFDEKLVLKCYSRAFTNCWAESYDLERLLHYKNTVMVAVGDKEIANKIREELIPLSSNRGYEYWFTENSDELSVLMPGQGDPVKGTYKWDFQTQTLTLNFKGQTERYTCDIQPEFPNFWVHQPRFIMAIKQDLTEKYASQYPESKVEDVYIIRHIMALGDWWLTEKINSEL